MSEQPSIIGGAPSHGTLFPAMHDNMGCHVGHPKQMLMALFKYNIKFGVPGDVELYIFTSPCKLGATLKYRLIQ